MVCSESQKAFNKSDAVRDRIVSLIDYIGIEIVQYVALLESLFAKELNQVSHLDLAQCFETDCRPILSFT